MAVIGYFHEVEKWRKQLLNIISILVAVSFLVSACGSSDSSATPPKFPPGSSLANIQKAGTVRIGVKFDQPGFGYRDPVTGILSGFDIEISKLIAQGIFGGKRSTISERIQFVVAPAKDREKLIVDNAVDMVIATYTINEERKQVISFAGPYFIAHGDLLTSSGNETVDSIDDLANQNVCIVSGTTDEVTVPAAVPDVRITFADSLSKCVDLLREGMVVAVSGDDSLLAGVAAISAGAFKYLDIRHTDEPYGIGVQKDDNQMLDFLNMRLTEIEKSGEWQKAWDATGGKLGLEATPPPTTN